MSIFIIIMKMSAATDITTMKMSAVMTITMMKMNAVTDITMMKMSAVMTIITMKISIVMTIIMKNITIIMVKNAHADMTMTIIITIMQMMYLQAGERKLLHHLPRISLRLYLKSLKGKQRVPYFVQREL